MEPKKRWDGRAVSFSYLEPGVDYRGVRASRSWGASSCSSIRCPTRTTRAPSGSSESASASPPRPLRDHAGDDMENDATSARVASGTATRVSRRRGWTPFENFLDGTATITSKGGWKWTDAMHDLGMHLADVAPVDVFIGSTSTTSSRRTGPDGIAMVRASRAPR